jgi:hypothetical protein
MTEKQSDTVERCLVLCPETAQPEEVELERTPCGAVIARCSRFEALGGVECTRACAVRLDERDRRDRDDVAPRVLVVYSGRNPQAKTIALALADHLSHDGQTAELADADSSAIPPPADYDAVVIGSSVRFGRHPLALIDYIVHSRDRLATMPSFFFSVGPAGNHDDLDLMCRATGWRPTSSTVFEHQVPDRRRFLHKLGGRAPIATELAFAEASRVRAFALAIGEEVPHPA